MSKHFFTTEEEKAIVQAIRDAESQTNGEIRVHVEAHCNGDAYKRAVEIFENIGMTQTKDKNGILFYLAYLDHEFCVIGDSGIHNMATDAFWMELKMVLEHHFKNKRFAEGLIEAITIAGLRLKKYFPKTTDNTNELSDQISFG